MYLLILHVRLHYAHALQSPCSARRRCYAGSREVSTSRDAVAVVRKATSITFIAVCCPDSIFEICADGGIYCLKLVMIFLRSGILIIE